MKYVDIINKYRREDETFTDVERNVSCWAPFQSIHINKKGELKVCPFIARSEREYENTTPFELDKNKYRARKTPNIFSKILKFSFIFISKIKYFYVNKTSPL